MYADGKMIKEIVTYLNGKGIKTRYGKPMSYNIIQYMLSNRKYIGEFKYRDIVIPNGAPAIISNVLQEQIKKPFLTKKQIRFGIEKFKQLDISTKEGKQRLIDGFINSIYLYDDKVTFTFNYKEGTKTEVFNELETAERSDMKCLGAP